MATLTRTRHPRNIVLQKAIENPLLVVRALNNRRFYNFLEFFWPEISSEQFKSNWHIEYLCDELQTLAERVAEGKPREYDLIINVPPGTTKTITCSIMFPAWCWTRWYWMRFIAVSYSGALSLESAEYSRDLVRSDRFSMIYPELEIKEDKDTKSNFKIVMKQAVPGHRPRVFHGGNRYSTSVGGTLTGFHGHMLIVDDPLNPHQAVSETELNNTNRWLDQTLTTRKVDKLVVPTVLIMQRLHEDDPTGHKLSKKNQTKVKHICLPGEIHSYADKVKPPELAKHYVDGLLDPVRLTMESLKDLEGDLGQYGYAGQIGQAPTPPKGGMFKVDNVAIMETMPNPVNIIEIVRYWDKAGTAEQLKKGASRQGAYTVGVKMARLQGNYFVIMDVKRGRWAAEEREKVIKLTAEADGANVRIYHEQEPGSGGKESAQATTRNLVGFTVQADLPVGDKIYRADPYSVQVNDGNVRMLRATWNKEFIEEHRLFPFSKFKDQVDAAAGAFSKLVVKRAASVR